MHPLLFWLLQHFGPGLAQRRGFSTEGWRTGQPSPPEGGPPTGCWQGLPGLQSYQPHTSPPGLGTGLSRQPLEQIGFPLPWL